VVGESRAGTLTQRTARNVLLVVVLGGLGYVIRGLDFRPAPFILGFVLGPLMEENFRRAMLIARGDFTVFFRQPISGVLMAVSIALLLWALWNTARPLLRGTARAGV
jgi:putative tricarboxylic transport membrane protein